MATMSPPTMILHRSFQKEIEFSLQQIMSPLLLAPLAVRNKHQSTHIDDQGEAFAIQGPVLLVLPPLGVNNQAQSLPTATIGLQSYKTKSHELIQELTLLPLHLQSMDYKLPRIKS